MSRPKPSPSLLFNARRRAPRIDSCGARRLAFFVAAPFCVFAVNGCRQNSSTNATQSTPAQSTPASKNSETQKSNSQDWNRVFNSWWRAWNQKPKTAPAQTQPNESSLPPVTIDIGAIAARHPAWKLAAALESNRVTTLDFAALRAAGFSAPSLPSPSFDVNLGDSHSGGSLNGSEESGGSTPAPVVEGYEREAETVLTSSLEALQSEAADHQRDALENFLGSVLARQTDALEDYESIRRAALENEVEATRATALPDIAPILLSPEDQLRVTNLRLQLGRNIFSTQAERDKANEQLQAILAAWSARLRQQSRERIEALQQVRDEAPRLLREQREEQLRRDLDTIGKVQTAARRLALQQHHERVLQDFGDENARLGIVLPAAFLPAQTLTGSTPPGGAPIKSASGNALADLIETNFSSFASQRELSRAASSGVLRQIANRVAAMDAQSVSVTSARRSTLIRALRSQAWRDAQKQAQLAARRFGWRRVATSGNGEVLKNQSSVEVTDRTRETLQWLFG